MTSMSKARPSGWNTCRFRRLTALGCVALFFFPGSLLDLLAQIPLR